MTHKIMDLRANFMSAILYTIYKTKVHKLAE